MQPESQAEAQRFATIANACGKVTSTLHRTPISGPRLLVATTEQSRHSSVAYENWRQMQRSWSIAIPATASLLKIG